MTKKTICDDDAIRDGVTLEEMLKDAQEDGYKIAHQYQHPAIGRVIELEKP